jgi:hypothetical protein
VVVEDNPRSGGTVRPGFDFLQGFSIKLFSTAEKLCAVSILALATFGLASCAELSGSGRVTEPQNAPARASVRHHGNIPAITLGGGSAASPTLSPFLGNPSAVAVPPANGVILQRQADCSLLLSNFTGSIENTKIAPTFESQTPHYEKIMRDNAFLSTPAGTFPNGCADQTLGVLSQDSC